MAIRNIQWLCLLPSNKTIGTCLYPESHTTTKSTNIDKIKKLNQFWEETVSKPVRSEYIHQKY